MKTIPCWVCGGKPTPFWSDTAFDATACATCGHLTAEHHAGPAVEADYHRSYDQGVYVESLQATRRRQAQRLLDALQSLGDPPKSLFDFGCGRGWLLEAALQRGMPQVAGGDSSALALTLLEGRGIPAIGLDENHPFEAMDFSALQFKPEVVTFLDVLEHFEGDLGARLAAWMRRLPSSVRLLVFKVPVRDGLLFSLARLSWHGGARGLGRQLFQVGTHPPHYQYFSRLSLGLFTSSLGLSPLATFDDIDFEPAQLGDRVASARPLVRRLGGVAGRLLGKTADALDRADSRVVIALRRSA